MNARKGIKTQTRFRQSAGKMRLKTMNARKGIKTEMIIIEIFPLCNG